MREYQVQQYHFYSPDLAASWDQYRIALISDIHIWDTRHLKIPAARARQARFDMLRMRELSQILEREPSQLLLLAGDYVSYRNRINPKVDLKPYFLPLKKKERTAVAVLGNHDHFMLPRNKNNPTIEALERANIQILVNETLRITNSQNDVMHIVGIDDFLYGKREPRLLENLSSKDFVVALAHNPDSFDLLQHPERVDIALAGHLHGGQITFFGLAPIVPAQRKYLQQPFQTLHYPVFVSNGLGASRIQLRIMAPPQIWFITLHSRSENKTRRYKPKYSTQKYRLSRSR